MITTQEIENKLSASAEFYKQRNINFAVYRALYFRDEAVYFSDENGNVIPSEPDEERIILPIAQSQVDTLLELLLSNRPAIVVPKSVVSKASNDVAEHNQKALLSIWSSAGLYEELYHSAWHGILDGWGVLKILKEDSSISEPGSSPYRFISVDPFYVYAMPGAYPNTWKYVIETKVMALPEFLDYLRVNGLDEPKGISSDATKNMFNDKTKVTIFEYWDDKQTATGYSINYVSRSQNTITGWLEGPTENTYGFIPYEIYFPHGLSLSEQGERIGLSSLYSVSELIKYVVRLYSNKATAVGRYMDPVLVTKTEEGRDFQGTRTGAGAQIKLYLEEDASYLQHPGVMSGVDEQYAVAMDWLERALIPRALQGSYDGAVSGVVLNLLRNPTLMKIAQIQKVIEQMCVRLNVKILKLIEKGNSFYVWGFDKTGNSIEAMIEPDKVQNYYRNEVKLSASLPTDDVSTVNMLTTLVGMKVLSKDTARLIMQQTLHSLVPQSLSDELERILSEAMLDNPDFINSLAQTAIENGGLSWYPGDQRSNEANQTRGGRGNAMPGVASQSLSAQQQGFVRNTNPLPEDLVQGAMGGVTNNGQ